MLISYTYLRNQRQVEEEEEEGAIRTPRGKTSKSIANKTIFDSAVAGLNIKQQQQQQQLIRQRSIRRPLTKLVAIGRYYTDRQRGGEREENRDRDRQTD